MARLEILGATYGTKLVTETVRGRVKDDALDVYADNATFGEAPPYGSPKTLVIAYRYEGQDARLLVRKEDEEVRIAYEPRPLTLLGAAYGPRDVTDVLRSRVHENALRVRADNGVFGDPWPRVRKTLSVVYRFGAEAPRTVAVKEGDDLSIGPAGGDEAAGSGEELRILGAAYGPADVTRTVASLVRGNALRVRADKATFGDPWPWNPKTLLIVYQYPGLDPRTLVVKEDEGASISRPHGGSLRIVAAAYGPSDVTEKVRSLVRGDALRVQAANEVFGDPWPGIPKTLTVIHADGEGRAHVAAVEEGKRIIIQGA